MGVNTYLTLLFLLVALLSALSSAEPQNGADGDLHPETAPTKSPFQQFEKSLRKRIFKMLLKARPYVKGSSSSSSQVNISSDCTDGITILALGLSSLSEWAFKMLDASGKISSGILEGNSVFLGDYDECLNSVYEEVKFAEYCMVEIQLSDVLKDAVREYQHGKNKSYSDLARSDTFLRFLRYIKTDPEKVVSRLGLCVPATCSVSDIQGILDSGVSQYGIPATVKRCEKMEPRKFEVHQVIILIIVAVFIGMVFVGTIMDLFCCSPKVGSSYDGYTTVKSGKFEKFYSSFSLCANTQRLVSDSDEKGLPGCCRGIIFLTVVMTVFTHTYALPHPAHISRYRSPFNIFRFADDISFSQVANSSAGVEIFFFLVGFMCVYNRLIKHENSSTNSYIVRFFLQNFLRMILAQTLVICVFMLLPLVGSGPLWQEFVEEPLNNCKEGWWRNLLFIQNFLSPYDSCLYNTWILATIMQIVILMCGTIWIVDRWPLLSGCLFLLIILAASIVVAVITAVADFPPTFAMYFYDYRISVIMWKYFYVQAYNHIGPYCIGSLFALLLVKRPDVKISKPVVVLCWLASFATLMAIVYGLYDYRDGRPMNRVLAVLYSATHRSAWAMAFGWILYACTKGHGGIIASILCWRAFVPLERLSYLAYLIHLPLMYYQAGIQRERIFMGHFSQVMFFFSYTVITFIISYMCYLVFQGPYIYFERQLFSACKNNVLQAAAPSDGGSPFRRQEGSDTIKEGIAVLFSKSSQIPDPTE